MVYPLRENRNTHWHKGKKNIILVVIACEYVWNVHHVQSCVLSCLQNLISLKPQNILCQVHIIVLIL